MNRPVVFCGPTVRPDAAKMMFPEADCRGPVARGDVLRASEERPPAICIIDGYFEHRPAVTHKEILWAMKRGIHVFGAASMGALRAAELTAYGMVGLGFVFDGFATGKLEDEDEVAVPHAEGPDFRPGAEALVNIRSTLAAAAAASVLGETTHLSLLKMAKAMFYADRSYPSLLRAAENEGVEPRCLQALRDWLAEPAHRVDQKRRDAEALLSAVRERLARGELGSFSPTWSFPATASWQQLRLETAGRAPSESARPQVESDDPLLPAILEEVQLLGSRAYEYVLARAALRKLCALKATAAESGAPGGAKTSATSSEEELDAVLPRVLTELHQILPEVLRSMGDEQRVRERAQLKRRLLAGVTLPAPNQEMVRAFWHRIGEPEVSSLKEAATALGFASEESLLRALAREEAFRQQLPRRP